MELNTTQKLCDYIAATYPNQLSDGEGALDVAVWFCCIKEAESLCQLNLKDLAGLIMHGVPSYTDDAVNAVQRWLDNYAEWIENSIAEDEEYTTLEALLEDHFTTPQ